MTKNKLLKIFSLLLVFSIGFFLRFHAYFVNNSFFVDEILLSFSVITRNYFGLLFPLDYFMAAPFLFLYLTKFVVSHLGIGELAFRLVPFLSSLLSVVAFYFLSGKVINRFWVRLLALFLFCTNFQLLFYAQTFKPYSSDVLVAILILLVALSIDIKKLNSKQTLTLGLLSSVAFCFSYTALFVIIGVTFVHLYFSREYKKIGFFVLPNLITLITYFIINLNTVKNTDYLNEYWVNGFNVLLPEIYKINYNFLFTYYNYALFFIFLLLLGVIISLRSDKFKSLILLSPIAVTFVAAILRIYPFERRLILFLLPILLLLIVIPIDRIKYDKKIFSSLVIIISAVYFINYTITFTTSFIAQKVSYLRQDVKPLLKILIKEKKKDDILYVYYGSNPSFTYYNMLVNLPKDNLYKGTMLEGDKNPSASVIKDLNNLPKRKIVWLFFVKGNLQYDKDVKIYRDFLYKKNVVKKDIVLKSARLIKVCL